MNNSNNFYSNYFIKVKKPKKIKPSQIKIDRQVLEKLRELKKASKPKKEIKYLFKIELKYNIYFYKIVSDLKELTKIENIKSVKCIDKINVKFTKSMLTKEYLT